MADGGHDGIIFLDRNRIFVYDGNGILRLDVPETITRDTDIIDKSGFDTLVDTFIKSKKINSLPVWLVLADGICFSKDVTEVDVIKADDEIKDFLEAIPFDKVISKKYKSAGGIRIIATNLEYIEAVMDVFDKDEFVMEGIVPGVLFPGFTTKKVLDPDFVKYILGSKNRMSMGNMLTKVTLPATSIDVPETHKKNKLLPFLLGGFALLLIILVFVLIAGK